jgi:hypothetical protein
VPAIRLPLTAPLARRCHSLGATLGTAGLLAAAASAQGLSPSAAARDPFRQLEEVLPTPNDQRAASGAPGAQYWQQRADYRIRVQLDDTEQRLTGHEHVTYHNHSPDTLRYLWLQLDNNIFAPDSHAARIANAPDLEDLDYDGLRGILARRSFDGALQLTAVLDGAGAPLAHVIVGTMLRLDLPQPLESGQSTEFELGWTYRMNDADLVGGRTAAEFFADDGNWIYEVAHWFPRLAAYTDVNGWQHKQFLGRGEFTLEFGDYLVEITVPTDHVVAATGVLQNPEDVLTAEQRERLDRALHADRPVLVITPEEALANQASAEGGTRTWVFAAQNVRDFAWASSRKFAWDALGVPIGDQRVLAMSYFPNEGEPLWSRYSTHAVAHTLEVYSRFTVPYPYPVAISVNGPVGGMEYPMICFNGPRPEEDGTYSERTKYGLIGVIIHEVGHNWFPMIINSDERQWTWMDEGLNTFVQYLAEQEWEPDYPSRRGEPRDIVEYMTSSTQEPIMTNSESIRQFGANAYAKPATALNLLRESVLGRELFDFAFAEYARRWAFKRPQPADLFRTLEDASAVDLDWFWRGWFYTTDHVDVSVAGFTRYRLDRGDPELTKADDRAEDEARPETVGQRQNRALAKRSDRYPELLDFYNSYDRFAVTPADRERFARLLEQLEPWERELLAAEQPHFTVVDLENLGGLVTPVILELEFPDGSRDQVRIPAELWRTSPERVSKLLLTDQQVVAITFDPHQETADSDLYNNTYPRRPVETRFQLFKRERDQNPMQEAAEAERKAAEGADAAASEEDATAGGGSAPAETPTGGTTNPRPTGQGSDR